MGGEDKQFQGAKVQKVAADSEKRARSAPDLATLCAESLWQQSLDAGMADELFAALKNHALGRAVLAAKFPEPWSVGVVLMVGDDGPIEGGTFGKVLWENVPKWLRMLIELQEEDKMAARSRMGGIQLAWEEQEQAGDWVAEMATQLDPNQLEEFLEALGISPEFDEDDEDEDGDEDGSVDEDRRREDWVENNQGDVSEAGAQKLGEYFDECSLVAKGDQQLITAKEMQCNKKDNIGTVTRFTIIIDMRAWG